MTAPASIDIQGSCAAGFEPVREAFARNFREHGEIGASVAVCLDGDLAVDLWAGYANADRSRPWSRDEIVNVYSTTKGIAALCAHMLADRGLIDFDAPVARYWPEFAQAGKEAMPVRYLLTHQSGLPVIDQPLPRGATLDCELMVHALEAQPPVWLPGTRFGYHTVTYGWLVGEVVRRVSGQRIGAFLHDEVTAPLGVDFFIGTPASEDHRIADTVNPPKPSGGGAEPPMPAIDPESLAFRSNLPGTSKPGVGVNGREYRAAEVPAGNGHGNARALATIYGALARGGEIGGTRLLSPEAITLAAREVVSGTDVVLGTPTRRSLGFMLPVAGSGDARGPRAFGHAGRGGSYGWADPEHRIGFGYTMNQMWGGGPDQPDPRANELARAVYASLEARRS